MGKRYERVWYMAMQEFLENKNRIGEIIAINRFCDSRGIAKVKVYVDKVTGKSIKRPEYQKDKTKDKSRRFADYPMRRKIPCFSYGDIRHFHRIYASN